MTEELEQSRGGIRDQLKEKDARINALVEDLGNSQAMLNDKVAELAEVCHDLAADIFLYLLACLSELEVSLSSVYSGPRHAGEHSLAHFANAS